MVKKYSNRIWVLGTLILLVLLVAIPSIIKVYNKHRVKLYNSVIDNAKYQALKCYHEDNCGDVITLKELYDLKYMDSLVNPLTKEIYDENTTFTIKNNKVSFNG